jgi:MoxR-like ATPase
VTLDFGGMSPPNVVRPLTPTLHPTASREVMGRLAENLTRAVRGKNEQARLAVTCLVARGHLLLEDVPGVGKTTMAEAIARSCGLSFSRIQFTADLLPSDILGARVFLPQTGTFELRQGPLFHQLVLADELNRAPPRTQSALLESMAQRQVTLDGTTLPLPEPFIVVATQNPADFSGTYPLPDSQLDRFLMRLSLGHPAADVEIALLQTRGYDDPVRTLGSVVTPEELVGLQQMAATVKVDPAIAGYAVALAHETRKHPEIERGASTRATLALVAAAKANALWEARDFTTPADIRAVATSTWAHRLLLKAAAHGAYSREDAVHLLDELLRKVSAPR